MTTLSKQPQLDLETVLGVLQNVKALSDSTFMARCPTHTDNQASLSVGRGDIKPVVVRCHAGCDQKEVWDAIRDLAGLPANGHTPHPLPKPQSRGKLVAKYAYTDENGVILKQKLRYDPKDFRQQAADGSWTTKGIPEVPYHLPRLLEAIAKRRAVHIPEGEKDVHTTEAHGAYATCNSGGAGKWPTELNKWFVGAYAVIVADWDEPGKAHALLVYKNLRDVATDVRIKRSAHGKDITDHFEGGGTLDTLIPVTPEELGYVPETSAGVITLSTVEATEVKWLWKDRIPLGMLSIQDGDPNQGKSMMLGEIAACVSRDGVMPDGSAGVAGDVMILASEDDLSCTIKPRLMAAKADQGRIHFLENASIPSGIEELEKLVGKYNIKLLIIDPLVAYFDEDVKTNSDASVRQALKPLAEMAARCQCAVVFNRHLNKNSTSGSSAIMRGGGSVGIGAQCRSGWLIGSFPNDPSEKFLAPTKWNLTTQPSTLKFKIEPDDAGRPRILWTGVSEITADKLVGASWTDDKVSEKDQQRKWLLKQLEDVTFMESAYLIELADQYGISKDMLKRLKSDLGIESIQRGGRWITLGKLWTGSEE